MPADVLSPRALNRATLARQLLLERAPCSVAAAVGRVGGLQAQEPRPPFIGLWSRVEGFEPAHLREALDAREVVRATLQRATLHLVTADDLVAFRAPLQPVLAAGMQVLGDRAEGLDIAATLAAARELLEQRPRTFDDLRTLLAERFPAVNERALGFAVRMHLPLVMVPTGDRWAFPAASQFALAERWLGRPLTDDPDPAPLVLRYLAAFGPASAADMTAWSGLTGMSAVFAALREQLVSFRSEAGRELFDLPGAPRPDEGVAAPARFLPEFDSLVLGHADRTRVISDAHRPGLVTKNLRVRACFLWDGVVAGTWTASVKRKVATLELAPFEPLPARARKALTAEGEVLLRFAEPDAASFAVRVA